MLKQFKHIAVEGVIGVGKTSFAKKLATTLDYALLLEEFDTNPFLEQFYEDPEKYALPTELHFLMSRITQQKEFWKATAANTVVSDYIIDKCVLFAERNLNTNDFTAFVEKFRQLTGNLSHPDLIIYLECSSQKLADNIKARGRIFEKNISTDYLDDLNNLYSTYLEQIQHIPILRIDTEQLDFVGIENDFLKIIKAIDKPHNFGVIVVKL